MTAARQIAEDGGHADAEQQPVCPCRSHPALSDAPPLLTVAAVVSLLGLPRSVGYRMVASGDLPSVKLAGRLYVPKTALVDVLAGRQP